jgi:transcriptional regulator with XRE-family HTH domain
MEIKEVFVLKLKKVLNERGITQKELAQKANITEAYVSQLLSYQKTPTIQVVNKIALALNVPVSYFLEDNDREISVYLRKNRQLTEEDIKAVEAFITYLLEHKTPSRDKSPKKKNDSEGNYK